MKFCQLTEYNMKNIFLENYMQNVAKKLCPDPFLKNQNWAYLDLYSNVLYNLFLLYAKLRSIKIYWN